MHPVRILYRDSEELFQSGREGVTRCDAGKHTAVTRRHLEAGVCRQTASVVDESLLEAGVDATAFVPHRHGELCHRFMTKPFPQERDLAGIRINAYISHKFR